ncbi:hypothetical protein KLU848_3091 [Kluyveromyces marxianus]
MSVVDSQFKTKSVTEVRDAAVQLSKDVVRLREEFDNALKGSYQYIIDTNESVKSLYADIQELDSELLHLCFDDEDLLPRITETELKPMQKDYGNKRPIENNVENKDTREIVWELTSHADFDVNEIHETLRISSWLIALSKFKRDPSVADNLDTLLVAFENLPTSNNRAVSEHCTAFGGWLLDETPKLTLDQYLMLYELMGKEEFNFNKEEKSWLFDQVLSHPDVLSGRVSSRVAEFTKKPIFRQGISQRLISQCEQEFRKWETNKDGKSDGLIILDPYNTEKRIPNLVHDINLYELGIVDSRRAALHECKVNVTKFLTYLKSFAEKEDYEKMQAKLEKILEEERIKISEMDATEETQEVPELKSSDMNSLVNLLMTERSNTRYIQYLTV